VIALGWFAGLRGRVAGRAFARTLFTRGGRPTRLEDVHAGVDHVICATDLHRGEHVYFSAAFVYSYAFGLGVPGDLPLHRAVQASAAFPGAFPVAWMGTGRFAFEGGLDEAAGAHALALHDGGVYDNMADQWEWGLPNRVKYAKDEVPGGPELLSAAQPAAASHLVVVNASRGMEGTSAKVVRPGLPGEIASALGAKDVLYDVSTATRRRLLVEMFARARRDPGDGPGGMLVHIGTSPWSLVESFGRFGGELGDRARAAGELLARATDLDAGTSTAEGRKAHWDAVTQADASVATTLAPLERLEAGSTARLLHHAWVLTRVSGHIFFGWGDVDPDDVDDWRRARFDRMVAASRTAGD
jgi:hypothetical protein